MNVNTIIDSFVEALARSGSLLDWSNDTYGKDHYIFVNFDVENPPGQEYCPFILLYPETKSVGQSRTDRIHTAHVVCCLHDTTFQDRPGYGNVVEYNGQKRSEEFRKLAETDIVGIDFGNGLVNFDVEYEPITDFPFFWSFMAVSVVEPVTMGSDYLS